MSTEDISGLIRSKSRQFGSRVALCQHGGDSREYFTYAGLERAAGTLAGGFVRMGIGPGDRVAILCQSRPRWGVVFFAALRVGAIVVPLDARMAAGELASILADARPRLLIVSQEHAATARGFRREHPALSVLGIEPESAASPMTSIDGIATADIPPCVARGPDDPAVLTYTSGTMGSSKGVVTTCGNLLHQVRSIRTVMRNDSHCSAVSILPLSHLFELTAGFLGVLYGGGRICYCGSLLPEDVAAAMREQRVTCMATVPLFLKLLARAIRMRMEGQPILRRWLCRAALAAAPRLPLSVRRRVFACVHREFGGRLEYFVCGGAPLDPSTLRFFAGIGLPVYQGYGLAETSPVISTNGPGADRPGSVGRPLPGVEVRIAADGEILTRGPHLMRGYFRNDALTREVVDPDGWLHTGDLGRIDRRGFLHICGRAKNAIVLGNGKKVQPEEIEDLLFDHPDIDEGCVVGALGRFGLAKDSEEVCAVAVPSQAAIRRCAERQQDPAQLLRQLIEARARQLAPGKRPTRFVLRAEPLPRTSTRKVRRPEVVAWLNREVAIP